MVLAGCAPFGPTLTNKTVVGIDHASLHTSEDVAAPLPYWQKQGWIIKYVPPYAPELHRIDSLWRRLTYPWLPFAAYAWLNALREAWETILSHVGSAYHITFA